MSVEKLTLTLGYHGFIRGYPSYSGSYVFFLEVHTLKTECGAEA